MNRQQQATIVRSPLITLWNRIYLWRFLEMEGRLIVEILWVWAYLLGGVIGLAGCRGLRIVVRLHMEQTHTYVSRRIQEGFAFVGYLTCESVKYSIPTMSRRWEHKYRGKCPEHALERSVHLLKLLLEGEVLPLPAVVRLRLVLGRQDKQLSFFQPTSQTITTWTDWRKIAWRRVVDMYERLTPVTNLSISAWGGTSSRSHMVLFSSFTICFSSAPCKAVSQMGFNSCEAIPQRRLVNGFRTSDALCQLILSLVTYLVDNLSGVCKHSRIRNICAHQENTLFNYKSLYS